MKQNRLNQARWEVCKFSIFFFNFRRYLFYHRFAEAVAQSCSVKKLFLEISQNSQENTCARVSLLIKLQAGL